MKCPKCGHEWTNAKAAEIAEKANSDPKYTAQRVLAAMPADLHPLPRRVWIKTFKETLSNPQDPRFIDMK